MTRTATLPRRSAAEFQAEVAQALLHLTDVPWLATESPLVTLPEVIRRSEGSRQLFADGQALADVLREVADSVADRLVGTGKVKLLRETVQGVCAGKSIAGIARELGYSREHFSRTYWGQAVGLVADELAALSGQKPITYNTRRQR